MWRVVNFRCFLLTALSCITTTAICVFFSYPLAVASVIVLSVIFLLLGVSLFISKNHVKAITMVLCFLCVVIVGAGVLTDRNNMVSTLEKDKEYSFTATVSSLSKKENGASLLLSDVTADGESIDGNVYLTVYAESNALIKVVACGDRLTFKSTATFKSIYDNPTDSGFAYKNDIWYYADVDESAVKLTGYNPTALQKLRNKIYGIVDENIDGYGAVAFGMLTGVTGEISSEVRSYYSASGLGHILAVSGLHVGFVVAMLSFICRKLKFNKWVTFAITLTSLAFYCVLASFSASIVRASVMCIIGLLASILGKRNDTLSSLSLAVTVILLVSPLYIFDVGFLLSVSAVLGILFFNKIFEKWFRKFLPRFISKPLATSLSAQIGITPVMIAYFGTFPVYSVITNLLFMPLITVTFMCLVVTLLITMIIPQVSILVSISGIGIALIDTIAKIVSLLPLSEIRVFAFAGLSLSLIALFICSKFVMLPRFKWVMNIVAIMAVIVPLTIYNFPIEKRYDLITTSAYKDVTCLLRTEEGVVLVGDCSNYSNMEKLLAFSREREVDRVYLTKCLPTTAEALGKLSQRYKIKAVYCPNTVDFSGLNKIAQAKIPFYLFYENDETLIVEPIFADNFVAYKYSEGTVSMLIVGYGAKINELEIEEINDCAIIRNYVFDGNFDRRAYFVNYSNKFVETTAEKEIVLDKIYAIDLSKGKYTV